MLVEYRRWIKALHSLLVIGASCPRWGEMVMESRNNGFHPVFKESKEEI